MAYKGDFGVTLPNMFGTPGQALQSLVQNKREDAQRQYEIDYRMRKDAEADDWRKLNLIRDTTDISNYKTGEAVADALGNKLMSNIYQKYTAASKSMSPMELQAGIQRDMSGLIQGMNGVKTELAEADKQLAAIKQLYPNANAAQLYDDYRKDIVSRHLGVGGTDFKNPMEVAKSTFNLNDPEFISKYISGTKNLQDKIANPKGLDATDVFVGTPDAYTKFTGKLAPWMQPNYDPSKLNAGFLPKGAKEPQLDIKYEDLPLDSATTDKPFRMATKETYDLFKDDQELIQLTRTNVPGYDNMSADQKVYAKRKILYDFIKANDRSNFHPTDVRRHYKNTVNVNTSKEASPIDLREYPDVDSGGKDITDLMRGVKVTGLPDGKSLLAEYVHYNPTTGKVSYKEYTDAGGAQPKTVSLSTFKQNIRTLNPQTDMKFLDGLNKPITGTQPKSSQPTMVTVTLKDGRKGEIPSDQVDKFLKDNPGSKRN